MLPEKKKKKMERRRRNSAICKINQSPQHFVTLARLALNISASIYKLTKRFPSPPVPSFFIPNLQIILCA